MYSIDLIKSGEATEKVYKVNDIEILNKESLKLSSEGNNLKIENNGGNKNYNLYIENFSNTGKESNFEHSNISLPANSSHAIQQSSENNVTIYVDASNDGTVDDSASVTNQYTSVENEGKSILTDFKLFQNYPNPFNPNTTISYSIPHASFVTIKVYDIMRREIQILVNEEKTVGYYSVISYGSNLASGIYFYKMQVGDFSETKKLILLK